jgi:3-hydroxybutyryl-CoA dehydrogenase
MDVVLTDNAPGAQEAGRRRVEASLDRGVRSGKVSEAERDATLARLTFTSDLGDFADRQLVVEAVAENESVKLDVFAALDKGVAAPDAILASNTSSIPIMKLAMATARPAQVVGIHFFNPVPVLHLVELIPSLLTGDDTAARAQEWATALGKSVVRAQDRAGFVVNALLIPYLLSAIRMFESGFASAQDIDNGMVLGCAHPMGPLKLSDLIGLDTVAAIADSMYAEYKEPTYAAPPLLRRMVEAGLLGKKTGRGFYEYAK